MNKLTAAMAIGTMCFGLSLSAGAAADQNPYEMPYDIETGRMFRQHLSTAVTNPARSDDMTEIGMGTLYHSNPLFGKPQAYAYTEAYQTSYSVRAKCDVNNYGSSTSTTGWREQNNTTACNSGTIKAATEKCTFTGYYTIQATKDAGVASSEGSYTYE